MIATYESLTGKTLYPAQVERLLIDLIAYRESLVREAFQDGAKLNLVRYSRGVILDNIGENVGVERVAAVAASVKLRFTFSPAPNIATVLPQGTEVEGGGVSFATAQAVTVGAGVAVVEVQATCTQAGVVGNGFVPGQIKTLVETPSGLVVASVENITTSEGGADEENDERLRERIVAAPETFSVAGSVEAYRFHAMSAHPDIVDVAVISHIPGDVTLYPLTSSGLPGEAIKAAVLATCSAEKVRPLNDQVMVADPVPVDYAIDVRVVLTHGRRGAGPGAGRAGREGLPRQPGAVRHVHRALAAHRRAACLRRVFRLARAACGRHRPGEVGVAALHRHQGDGDGSGVWLTSRSPRCCRPRLRLTCPCGRLRC